MFLSLYAGSCFAVPPQVKIDTTKFSPLEINSETEKNIFSDKAYIYKEEEIKHGKNFIQQILDWFSWKKDKEQDEREDERNKDLNDPGNSFWNGDFMSGLVAVICIAGILGGIIYLLVTGKYKKLFSPKPLENPFDFKEITEDLEALNIEKLIKEATVKGDYRLATRWWYLKILKILSEKELITWKPHKTNFDYYHELKDNFHLENFKKASYVYENVWYGEMQIDSGIYNQYLPQFVEFEKSLNV